MKNVLLLVHDDDGQEARLQAALDVVRAVEGHLICLDVIVMPELAGDYYGTTGILLAEEQEREEANHKRLEERLKVEGMPWSWVEKTGRISTCIGDAAALADLIVVNRKLDSFPMPDMRGIAGELLHDVSVPLLAVPEHQRGLDLSGDVLVAWNGSAAASTALQAAVPLLKMARNVTLFEIEDNKVRAPAEEAAAYLSRNDIPATVRTKAMDLESSAAELLREVQLHRPAYVVMGGFGHSRAREALFDGVTRRMLTESPVPLFLAH